MRRILSSTFFLLAMAMPMVAFANPNTDSPEPEFWAFLLLGLIPAEFVLYRQVRGEEKAIVPVRTNR